MEGRFSCTGWRNSALGVSKIEMILLMLVLCGIGVYVWWMREIPMSIDSKVWSGKLFTGRPDAVIKKGPWIIPVEFKSANHEEPMESHKVQLLCYCFLLEENGYNVPYGILRYRGKKFKIHWNSKAKRYLMKIAEEAIQSLSKNEPPLPLAENDNRCYKCPYRFICKQ